MKIKFLIILSLTILVGFLSAKMVHAFYSENKNNFNVYVLEAGPYEENIVKEKEKQFDYYVTYKDNESIYIICGISTSLDNINKLKKIYSDTDIKIIKKYIDNQEFITSLEQYDLLIDGLSNKKDILSVNKVILSSYEDLILR